MITSLNFVKIYRLHFLLFLAFAAMVNTAESQKRTLAQKLQDAQKTLRQAKETVSETAGLLQLTSQLIYSAEVFSKVSKMSSADFNKNVKVVKADTGKSNPTANIPAKKITQPKIVDGKFTNLNWQPVVYFDNQLFPSAIISLANYSGESPNKLFEAIRRPLGFYIVSDKSNIPLRWEIECVDKNYFDKVTGSFIYGQAREIMDRNVNIPWNYKALVGTLTTAPVGVYFRLFDEEGNKVEQLVTLKMRSINDCIFQYRDLDLKFMFSAYVQEEHPQIDNILREGINTKMINAVVGHQFDSNYVDQQVAALWRVLHERGFVYSSITKTVGDNDTSIRSQVVRTFDNSLKTSQANCVDGTVVFASILQKIGIEPLLVVVPGHCFLGYYAYYKDKDHYSIHYLETTMLSNTKLMNKNKQAVDVLAKAKTSADKNIAYMKLFNAARMYAEYEFYDEFKNQQILIDVSYWRALVGPIPIYN